MEAIETGEETALLACTDFVETVGSEREYRITLRDAPRRAELAHSGTPTTRPRYLEAFPARAILLSPMDLNILYLGPDLRRHLLDEVLTLTYSDFATKKRAYDQTLRARNRTIRDIRSTKHPEAREMLPYWTRILAEKAYEYLAYRERIVTYIQSHMDTILALLPEHACTFEYLSRIPPGSSADAIRRILDDRTDKDLLVGYTTA